MYYIISSQTVEGICVNVEYHKESYSYIITLRLERYVRFWYTGFMYQDITYKWT